MPLTSRGYGLGYKPDPKDHRKVSLRNARELLQVGTLPLIVDRRPFVAILDQRQTSSCTGHATAGAINTFFASKGTPIAPLDPVGIYDVTRIIDRVPGPGGKLPPLEDNGAEPNAVMRALREWGAWPASMSEGGLPPDPSTINEEPSLAQLEAASEFELLGEYSIDSTGDQLVVDFMAAVAAAPVTISIEADSDAFQGYSGGVLGGQGMKLDHYVYCASYSWDGVSLASFVGELTNSWGLWGDFGFAKFNRNFLAQTGDRYAMRVAR